MKAERPTPTGDFSLDITRMWWIRDDGKDDPDDHCLHGHVIARIGDGIWEDDCTLSAAAMRLPYGTDWTVLHEDGRIKIILEDGTVAWVDMDQYRAEVFRFCDRVKAYYDMCAPKNPPDEYDRDAWIAFWREWKRRREG